MRNTIDYGIYFNNDFCQIARMENGIPVIIKSNLLKDSMPLCVSINRKQDILVGDIALNVLNSEKIIALKTLEKNKTNTFVEFTRTLGTTYMYESVHANRSFGSEELLAECFKKLRSFVQDENLSSIVITVPAKFLNPQNEATMQAAKLAGFKHIELLQEPVAAATAYGLDTKNKDGYWLVFDFGGGTFDAALIKAEQGILTVKDTDGDNWLGGKNLDEAIVDQILLAELTKNFNLDSVLKDSNKKEILRNVLKSFAETAKNQLSFKEKHNVYLDDNDLQFLDDNGEEPILNLDISQNDLEKVLSPIFQKAIDITKELIKRNNLKSDDLGALILVGGPTYSPILRRMLREQITDKVDTSVDPMTVVAKGAALFASTISVSSQVLEAGRDKTKLQLEVNYYATTVQLDEMVSLKVLKEKSIGVFPEKIYADVVRSDDAWSSGKKLIGEKSSIVEVLLVSGSNVFNILVYDEQGNKLECQPSQFLILQGIDVSGMTTLPYHIGIGKYFDTEGKDLFMPVNGLEKNKKIPATGILNGLKTTFDLGPGIVSDVIRIPIYQGDHNAAGTNPVLNNLITEVIITGESLPGLLPIDSDVDITIKVDSSQLMKFTAYFPLFDYMEELEIDIKAIKLPTKEELSKQILKAKKAAEKINAAGVSENLEALELQLENEKGSAGGKMKILDGLRKELLKIDGAEKLAEWPKVEQELKDAFYELEELIIKMNANWASEELDMDSVQTRSQVFKKNIEHIIKDKSIINAKELIRDLAAFYKELSNSISVKEVTYEYIDNLVGKLVLFYSDNPAMGKDRFRFLLAELIKAKKEEISQDDKIKIIDSVKNEIIKWK